MRKLNQLILGAFTLLALACSPQPKQEQLVSAFGTPYHWEQGTIVVDLSLIHILTLPTIA